MKLFDKASLSDHVKALYYGGVIRLNGGIPSKSFFLLPSPFSPFFNQRNRIMQNGKLDDVPQVQGADTIVEGKKKEYGIKVSPLLLLAKKIGPFSLLPCSSSAKRPHFPRWMPILRWVTLLTLDSSLGLSKSVQMKPRKTSPVQRGTSTRPKPSTLTIPGLGPPKTSRMLCWKRKRRKWPLGSRRKTQPLVVSKCQPPQRKKAASPTSCGTTPSPSRLGSSLSLLAFTFTRSSAENCVVEYTNKIISSFGVPKSAEHTLFIKWLLVASQKLGGWLFSIFLFTDENSFPPKGEFSWYKTKKRERERGKGKEGKRKREREREKERKEKRKNIFSHLSSPPLLPLPRPLLLLSPLVGKVAVT